MGRLDRIKQVANSSNSVCLDLNEGNVQAIFNRCLAKPGCENRVPACLYYERLGYSRKDSIDIDFDSDMVARDKKSLMYLYGQLDYVHTGKYINERMSISDFAKAYTGKTCTQSKAAVLELLYLGCNHVLPCVTPFEKRFNDTAFLSTDIKPTLSPKDPAFPEWWEQHKAEWED